MDSIELKKILLQKLLKLKEKRYQESWDFLARDSQKIPDRKDWLIWIILAGRGFGKTRTGAETVKKWVETGQYKNIALVGDSIDDAREIMVEGKSGLLEVCKKSSVKIMFEPSKRKISWSNGAKAMLYSSENYEKLRGPEFDLIWIDELAKFRNDQETFDHALLALRIGTHPKMIITTTPKPTNLIKSIIKRDDTVVTKGSTYENIRNLAPEFINQIRTKLEGTDLGRQEIHAEILTDKTVNLWSHPLIENAKICSPPPYYEKIIISIDPAITAKTSSDETGIIVAGLAPDGTIFIIDDYSTKEPADFWTDQVIALYYKYSATNIVVETNAGGDLIEQLIHIKDKNINIKPVFALKSKTLRAEPIVLLYQKNIVKHLSKFEKLEHQMITYTPDKKSPDRMDALVWAVYFLYNEYNKLPKISVLG